MKIIHTGDVHLGVEPDRGKAWTLQRKEEIWNSFRGLIDCVREEKADFLIIAGDLFHRPPTKRELHEINYLFSGIPDTKVVLVAGNHDHIRDNSTWLDMEWEENVIGLFDRELQKVSVPEKQTALYGCSYYEQIVRDDIYAEAESHGNENWHILVAHGGDADHAPFDPEALAERFSYVAAAHIHKPAIHANGRFAFCGSLEPINRNETGRHGYMRIVLQEDTIRTEFVPFASRSYNNLKVTVRESITQMELENTLRHAIEKRGTQNYYRILLQGKRADGMAFSKERLSDLGNITDVQDNTAPAYDLDVLLHHYEGTLIGAYIRRFRDSDDPIEKQALQYGLEALLASR